MVKKKVFYKMNEYIGLEYLNNYVITADDMIMNVISYHFARNYSNINIPGYMYNLRGVSMSRGDGGIELKIIRSINHLFYFKLLYKYIQQFQMNRKSLYLEIKSLKRFIYYIKDYNITSYNKEAKGFLNEIIIDKYANNGIKHYISELLFYLEEEQEKKWF